MATSGPAVRLHGVTTLVDGDPILVGLDLHLRPGAITVLMGPSGAGKTTVVRHLAGLLDPTAGRVLIGDRELFTADPDAVRDLRHGMGVLLGGSLLFDSSLFGGLTAFDNIGYGLSDRGIDEDTRLARTRELLRELGLAEWAAAKPHEMPAHARRRLALARALAPEAPLVLLDEIETGADIIHAADIVDAIRRRQERTGATLLVTTHDLDLARALGGTLAILAHGRIVGTGSARDLLRGVVDGGDFERRFVGADALGPPTRADAARALAEREDDRSREIDIRVVFAAVAALIAIAALAAFYLTQRAFP